MKVLHVISSLYPASGGTIITVLGLTKALAKNGLDVSIFTTNYDVNGVLNVSTDYPLIKDNVKIYYFKVSYPRFIRYSPSFATALEGSIAQFDLIHIHGLWHFPTSFSATTAHRHNIAYIISPDGCLDFWPLRNKWWRKKIYAALWELRNLKKAQAIHCLNKEEEFAVKRSGIESPTVIIPNGLDITEYEHLPRKGSFRTRYPELLDKKIILFLGRIDKIKGLDILIPAFSEVVREAPDAHLVIAGPDSGEYSKKVYKMAAKANLVKYITFTGMLRGLDKLSLLSDADIFVLPSYHESHSNAINEALFCGLPLVITKPCNFAEVETVNAGFVVENNAKQLQGAITTLLRKPSLCKEMGGRGRQLIFEKYTWDKISKEMIEMYNDVYETFQNTT